MAFYAVKKGNQPGVYATWDEAKEQVHGFKGAIFKKFNTKDEANSFINGAAPVEITEKEEYKPLNEEADAKSMLKDTISIYTDGSNNDKGYYGGYVIIKNGKVIKRGIVIGEDMEFHKLRNVAGEIIAVTEVIKFVIQNFKTIKHLHIYSDYSGLGQWSIAKEDGGWARNNKYTKRYGTFMEAMKERLNIHMYHVKGHIEDPYNEEADTLASYAAKLHENNSKFDLIEYLENYSYIEKQMD